MIQVEILARDRVVGSVQFKSIRSGAVIYAADPAHCLTAEEAQQLAGQLCVLPSQREGLVGHLHWREVPQRS